MLSPLAHPPLAPTPPTHGPTPLQLTASIQAPPDRDPTAPSRTAPSDPQAHPTAPAPPHTQYLPSSLQPPAAPRHYSSPAPLQQPCAPTKAPRPALTLKPVWELADARLHHPRALLNGPLRGCSQGRWGGRRGIGSRSCCVARGGGGGGRLHGGRLHRGVPATVGQYLPQHAAADKSAHGRQGAPGQRRVQDHGYPTVCERDVCSRNDGWRGNRQQQGGTKRGG